MNLDIENADIYFSERLGAESWAELENEKKQAAITTAKDNINQLHFIGTKLNPQQPDAFPRNYKGKEIQLPDDVIKAIFEEAFYLINSEDMGFEGIPDGVQSLSLGSASISFKSNIGTNSVNNKSMKFLDAWLQKGFDIESTEFREVY